MPPGSASASSRAAMLTPSPKMSSPSMTMSPRLMPTRYTMRSASRQGGLGLGDGPLDAHGAVKRVDDAGELDQQPVAERFDHAPAILRRQRLDDRLPVLPVAGDRAGLVGFHVAGIADHVDGQDGSQPAYRALGGQDP